jgi:hypothetical protein
MHVGKEAVANNRFQPPVVKQIPVHEQERA